MNLIKLLEDGIPQKEDHILKINWPLFIFLVVLQFPFHVINIIFGQFAFLSAKCADLIQIISPNYYHYEPKNSQISQKS